MIAHMTIYIMILSVLLEIIRIYLHIPEFTLLVRVSNLTTLLMMMGNYLIIFLGLLFEILDKR